MQSKNLVNIKVKVTTIKRNKQKTMSIKTMSIIEFLIPSTAQEKDIVAVLANVFNVPSNEINVDNSLLQDQDYYTTIKTDLENPLGHLPRNEDGKYDLSENFESYRKKKENGIKDNGNNDIPDGKQEKEDNEDNEDNVNLSSVNRHKKSTQSMNSQPAILRNFREAHKEVIKKHGIGKKIKFIADDRTLNYPEAKSIQNQYGKQIKYIYQYNPQDQRLERYRIDDKKQSLKERKIYKLDSELVQAYHMDKKIRFWNETRQLCKVKKINRDEYALALKDLERSLLLFHTAERINTVIPDIEKKLNKNKDVDANQIRNKIEENICELENQTKKSVKICKEAENSITKIKEKINNNNRLHYNNELILTKKLTLKNLEAKHLDKRQEIINNARKKAGIDHQGDQSYKDYLTLEKNYRSHLTNLPTEQHFIDQAKVEYINLYGYCCQIIYSKDIKFDIKSKGDIIFHTTDGTNYTIYGMDKTNSPFKIEANPNHNTEIQSLLPNKDFEPGVPITIENDKNRAKALNIAQTYGSIAKSKEIDSEKIRNQNKSLEKENARFKKNKKRLEKILSNRTESIETAKNKIISLQNQNETLSESLETCESNQERLKTLKRLKEDKKALKTTSFLVETLNNEITQKIISLEETAKTVKGCPYPSIMMNKNVNGKYDENEYKETYDILNKYIDALRTHHEDIKTCLQGDRHSGASLSQLNNLYNLVSNQCTENEFLQRSTDQGRITWYKSALKVCAALAVLTALTGLVLLTCGIALPFIAVGAGATLTSLPITAKISIGISVGLMAGGLPVKTGAKCIDKLSNIAPGRVVMRHMPTLPQPCFFKKRKARTKRINHIHDVYDAHKKLSTRDTYKKMYHYANNKKVSNNNQDNCAKETVRHIH